MEIVNDPVVLQHKLLALIPITFGIVGILRLRGTVGPRGWMHTIAALAVAGGSSLFFHFHEGRFHLDAIYLQHVAMGSTALALGVTLVVAGRRHASGARLVRWVWPVALALLGLVLLVYSEI